MIWRLLHSGEDFLGDSLTWDGLLLIHKLGGRRQERKIINTRATDPSRATASWGEPLSGPVLFQGGVAFQVETPHWWLLTENDARRAVGLPPRP
jgi:hypothetical protein